VTVKLRTAHRIYLWE